MKKALTRLLAAGLILLLAACTGDDTTSNAPTLEDSTVSSSVPSYRPPIELPDVPLEDINPLTGEPRPEGLDADTRPVAVMVANNAAALPQRGLARADVLYEMLTEGGITRIMALYADPAGIPEVGPVRSARDSFVQLAVPQNAVLVHIGSSVYASNLLNVLAYQNVDGIYLGRSAFRYDTGRNDSGYSNEYCWYTDATLVQEGISLAGVEAQGEAPALFQFGEVGGDTDAYSISIHYSSVSWSSFAYSKGENVYFKYMLDKPHEDEDGTYLRFTNVMLLYYNASLKPDKVSTEFDLTSGTGLYFTGGSVQQISWQKDSPSGSLQLYGQDGQQLTVSPGKSYIGFVPSSAQDAVQYEAK